TDLGRFVRVNDALCRLSRYSTHQLTAMSALDLVHPDERDLVEGNLRRAAEGRRTPFRGQRRVLQASGESIWVQVMISPVLDGDGVARYAVAHLEPLRARDTPEREHSARHDLRTGLLTPSALLEELAAAMARVCRHETTGAVLLCDLGDLAGIADPQARDRALAVLADNLGQVLREGDIRGHLDENRLLVAIEEIDAADTAALADRIIAALTYTQPGEETSEESGEENSEKAGNEISGRVAVEMRASIGIAPFTSDSGDVDAVLQRARDASSRARAHGPGTRVLWDRDDTPPQPPARTKHNLYRRTEHLD
ncbi:MAG: GGDEF domain-containing protein, partial [Streptosporangiaceae bacterium]